VIGETKKVRDLLKKDFSDCKPVIKALRGMEISIRGGRGAARGWEFQEACRTKRPDICCCPALPEVLPFWKGVEYGSKKKCRGRVFRGLVTDEIGWVRQRPKTRAC